MPELPEVETVAQGLSQIISPPLEVSSVRLACGDLRTKVQEKDFSPLVGEKILGVSRRAKYILFESENHILISHLGMTGSWRREDSGGAQKHDHFQMEFQGGLKLIFNDPRRFGLLKLIPRGGEREDVSLRGLGPEPLEPEFSEEYVWKETRGKIVAIKIWLMDQRKVVGVGNIYASEALFLAGIRPRRQAGTLQANEITKMIRAVQRILKKAIQSGGSTIRDYRNADGGRGGFAARLKVYGRAGENCPRCGALIKAAVLGGRSTYWCGACQK